LAVVFVEVIALAMRLFGVGGQERLHEQPALAVGDDLVRGVRGLRGRGRLHELELPGFLEIGTLGDHLDRG
jgi:hypothetical protein